MNNVWIGAAVANFLFMNTVFILAVWKKRNDYADVAWGPGFIVTALGALFVRGFQMENRLVLVLTLVCLWALRLFIYLGIRNLSHDQEDARYQKMRNDWGSQWIWKSYLWVFGLQGLLMYLIATPMIHTASQTDSGIDLYCYIGALIWLIGFIFESVSDQQMKDFKKDSQNKGKIMTTGLWSWSRHPNYFGEATMWWGIAFVAVGLPGGWWTLLSPILITFLLLKVSGVPLLEKAMENRPGFSEYKNRTSIFVPWPPKK